MRETKGEMKGDEAVTPIIGYILLLAVILGVVTSAYYWGLPLIASKQKSAMMGSSEEALSGTLNLMWDVAKSNSQEIRREIQLKLGNGLLYLDDGARIQILLDGNEIYEDYTGALVCRYGEEGIVIENGAEIRFSRENSIMVREPRGYDDNNTVVLSILKLSGEKSSKSGNSIQLSIKFLGYTRSESGSGILRIIVDGEHKEAYDDFFHSLGFSGGNGEYERSVAGFELNIYEIEVEIK